MSEAHAETALAGTAQAQSAAPRVWSRGVARPSAASDTHVAVHRGPLVPAVDDGSSERRRRLTCLNRLTAGAIIMTTWEFKALAILLIKKGPMTQPYKYHDITNHVLRSLPPATLTRILPHLELLNTARWQIIDHVDRPIKYLYFVNRGLVSFVKTMQDGRSVEIGAVGIEGVTDPNALFSIDRAIVESMVQIPGIAFRIRRDVLRDEMVKDHRLREMMQNCARFAIGQFMQTAACNRLHSLEERCCRWLLMAHESALSDTFPITHEFLAMMLGVQRAGVSIAASFLQKAGLIAYTRGRVTITNRLGLEDVACECYGTRRAELYKLFAAPKPR